MFYYGLFILVSKEDMIQNIDSYTPGYSDLLSKIERTNSER